jgi:hypothetical protein
VASDVFTLQKVQAADDGPVVTIPFLDVQVSSGKMRSEEAEACVVVIQAYTYRTLVARHAS